MHRDMRCNAFCTMRWMVLFFSFGSLWAGDPPSVRIELTREEFRPVAQDWKISGMGLTEDGHVIVPGKKALLQLLNSLDVPYSFIEEISGHEIEDLSHAEDTQIPSSYFDPDSFETWVTDLVNSHPAIARLIQIGSSVQSRPIWAVKISANCDVEEFEPELRVIANIHGDEKASLMVCTDVMEWILTHYGSNSVATDLVDGTEMWFVPMVNPDGNAYDANPGNPGLEGRRTNMHGVDLNRNFDGPQGNDPFSGGAYPFSEPETQAIKALSDSYDNVFLLGLSLHSGAACFNSVWNSSTTAELPDLANFFSSRTGGSPCGNSSGHCAVPAPDSLAEAYFNGCTYSGFWYVCGADWYITFGDTNDWSYYFESTLDTTIEITQTKTPPAHLIPDYTQRHRNGVLNYLYSAFQGIHGLVTDQIDGTPLEAEITVVEFPKPVRTGTTLGDYHRYCVPGRYAIRVEAEGYHDRNIGGVAVLKEQRTRVDVQMIPDTYSFVDIASCWPNEGPFDSNENGRVDVLDLIKFQ